MDKRLILAVAGSGKTTHLINQLNETERFLLITYTKNNVNNLRSYIIKKFGYFPPNIKVYSYYTFLYSICYKPYLHDKLQTKGINFNTIPPRFKPSTSRGYYIDKSNRLYFARISKIIIAANLSDNILNRLCKYFDHLFIDEIQDFAGHDFNFLKELSKAGLNQIYVGDFYQHTFDTSRDGNTNSTLHDDLGKFISEFKKMGVIPDTKSLSKSYRCSPSICKFITEKLLISIESDKKDNTAIEFIDNLERAEQIINDNSIIKLFYKEHYKHNCFSRNWGESKGENNYFDVCVVLNKTTLKMYNKGKLNELPPASRNKLYVALSRANNNVYMIAENLIN